MIQNITISGFADEIDPSLDKQIEVIKKLGISHIEMRGVDGKGLVEYPLDEVKKIKEKLDANGIKLSAVGSPIGKIQITDAFEEHFELFKHTVEIAKIMETPYIRMFSFFMPEGEEPGKYKDEVFRRLGMFVEYAKQQDVVLLHENEKEIYGDVAVRCKEILDEFACDHFHAVFDFANFVQCKQDTKEAYEMLKPYISYIHIKDALWENAQVVPAGHGDGNVKEILADLVKNGYEGVFSLEPHLIDFNGFADLEQGETEKKESMSGEEAYTTAYNALRKIVEELE
ncbi:MAG: sugar phosphate isomerase/epimerase [Oliverpabstia sp.]|nr:sugar phosphate isomerase/epimerase [Lachnospiraceae bacterium]MDY5026428.1 sugar phosphate isomerase/epimerase [Oliverpabstia sp.]